MTLTPITIDDLSMPFPLSSVGTRWQLVSDAVMGGVSAGSIMREVVGGRPAIRMQGDVSLENSGGFIQIALDLAPRNGTVDGSAFSGIAIDVLGNGEEYGLHLRTPELVRPWQSYRQGLVAGPSWKTVELPFTSFACHRTDLPLDTRHLRRLGIVAIGRAFRADVSVGDVRFY